MFIIGNHAKQINSKDFCHIVYGHHIPSPDHVDPDPVDQKIIIADSGCLEKTNDAVRITDCRDFRGCNYKGSVSSCDRILKSLLNTCRTVKQNKIKIISEIIYEFFHLLW